MHPDISQALRKHLADEQEHLTVRGDCAKSLGQHRDRLAIPALIDLLNTEDTQHHDSFTEAAVALGSIAISIRTDSPEDYNRIVEAFWPL